MIKLIKPCDMIKKRPPDKIFLVFNKMIQENWDGFRSTIYQDDILKRIESEINISRDEVLDKNYLDVEDYYRESGWLVEYNGPAYYETFKSIFIFKPQ